MFLFLIISQTFPEPYGFVNDYANVLNNRQREDLENQLRKIENVTSVEIAIAMFDSIGYPIEDYANLLFEKWGIGKKNKDNGILIIVSMKERLIRIEVGYGLESIITDGIAGEIIRKRIIPYFREGNYYLGLKSAINGIQERLSGEYKEDKEDKEDNENERIYDRLLSLLLLIGLTVGSALGYFSIFISIILFIIFLISKSLIFLMLSIGFFIGGLLLRSGFGGGGYFPSGFGDVFSSRGGFGGFGGGLSGGGGATGRW